MINTVVHLNDAVILTNTPALFTFKKMKIISTSGIVTMTYIMYFSSDMYFNILLGKLT